MRRVLTCLFFCLNTHVGYTHALSLSSLRLSPLALNPSLPSLSPSLYPIYYCPLQFISNFNISSEAKSKVLAILDLRLSFSSPLPVTAIRPVIYSNLHLLHDPTSSSDWLPSRVPQLTQGIDDVSSPGKQH